METVLIKMYIYIKIFVFHNNTEEQYIRNAIKKNYIQEIV